ncbi:MAG TPA: aminodeoxychorismate lyase, partial [Caulobacteraceae bacterium]|nr:aminodeoxychorismate lyase [Caulobacteraceae bacterium]
MSRAPRGVARARRRGRGLPVRPSPRQGAVLLLVVLAAAIVWVGWTYAGPGPRAPKGETTTVFLERGSGLAKIASELDKAEVVRSALLFTLAAMATGASEDLKAGE